MAQQMFQEVTPIAAYERLKENKDAILIDCRTEREWEIIGTPDLSKINKSIVKIELLTENQSINSAFVEQVAEHAQLDTPLYVICKSGARSGAACQILLKAGFSDVTNVAEGFEGNQTYFDRLEINNGWQGHNLPWKK